MFPFTLLQFIILHPQQVYSYEGTNQLPMVQLSILIDESINAQASIQSQIYYLQYFAIFDSSHLL